MNDILKRKKPVTELQRDTYDKVTTTTKLEKRVSNVETQIADVDTRLSDLESATPANYILVCKISQSGTGSPSVQIVQNTFPDTLVDVTASRAGVGDYTVTLDSTEKSWSDFNTVCYFNSQIGPFQSPPQTAQYHINHNSTGSGPNFYTNFRVRTYNISGAALADSQLSQHTFTIIVAA